MYASLGVYVIVKMRGVEQKEAMKKKKGVNGARAVLPIISPFLSLFLSVPRDCTRLGLFALRPFSLFLSIPLSCPKNENLERMRGASLRLASRTLAK